MPLKLATEVLSKTVYEKKIYTFDFSADMATGETISSVAHTISPTGPSLSGSTYSGQQTQITIDAGTADTMYTVTSKVVTSTGEEIEGTGYLWVRA